MLKCHCGQPAEVHWFVAGVFVTDIDGGEPKRQEHDLCSNFMSHYWEIINKEYPVSCGQQCSTFTVINQ